MSSEKIYVMDVEPGDLLVGFQEDGFRSIGSTVASDAFEVAFGENWQYELIEIGSQLHKLGDLALRPPSVYTEAITNMNTGYDVINVPKVQVKEAIEVTDGGIPGSLGRNLQKTGLGADVIDPFEPPTIALLAQAFHPDNISDEDAYSTWCLGQGMIAITPESDADDVIRLAAKHDIAAKVIGYVTKQPGIRIRSAGIHKTGQLLSYPAP